MSDKLRTTFPISVSFGEGELPSATKLNGLSSQAKNGLSLLEHAVGDLWNQAGDSLLQPSSNIIQNALMMPNLARAIGPHRFGNPRIPDLPNITRYTWYAAIKDDYAVNNQAYLDFPPAAGGTTWNWSGSAPLPTGNPKASPGLVQASGDWYVDTQTGRVVFYDVILGDWQLEYEPRVTGQFGTLDSFNIIPDPDTDLSWGFNGVKIEYVNGTDNAQGYYVFLPPRGPLNTRTFRRGPYDVAENYDSSPTSGEFYFWQDDAVDATTTSVYAEHYRYNLPWQITNNWSTAARIGSGQIYLWDITGTGTILEGVDFSAENAGTPRTWVFVAQGTALDTYLSSPTGQLYYPAANLQNSSHAAAMYPSAGLRVLVSGISVGESLSRLWYHFLQHDHSSDYDKQESPDVFPTSPVDHGDLHNNYYRDDNTVGAEPYFHPSAWVNDWHPQYIHRKGIGGSGFAGDRDRFKNGMLGDLFFCSTDLTSDYDNMAGDSHGIRFGDSSSSGPYLYHDSNQEVDGLSVKNTPLYVDTIRPRFHQDLYGFSYSNGYWGPVRIHKMSPEDFTHWDDGGTAPYNKISTSPAGPYNTERALTLYMDRLTGGVNQHYAMGHFNLPWAHYGVVALAIKLGSIGHTFGASELWCSMGYSTGPTGTGSPTGTIATNGGVDYDVHDATGDISSGSFDAIREIFSAGSGSPFMEIKNNRSASGYANKPWVRFRQSNGPAGYDLVIAEIQVYYRIKEY